jgi:hypothetical protein
MAYLQSITMLVIWAGSATHHARTPLPAALVRRGNAQAADQSFSLLTWQILTLHSCVGAAVNGFGGYRECWSCGRRGHCGA